MTQEYENLPPCPFCGSNDLESSRWVYNENEVEAIECRTCWASATSAMWQNRFLNTYQCPSCAETFTPSEPVQLDSAIIV